MLFLTDQVLLLIVRAVLPLSWDVLWVSDNGMCLAGMCIFISDILQSDYTSQDLRKTDGP